ncbi:hypothetical protein ES702_00386 [subsurface metagenome]
MWIGSSKDPLRTSGLGPPTPSAGTIRASTCPAGKACAVPPVCVMMSCPGLSVSLVQKLKYISRSCIPTGIVMLTIVWLGVSSSPYGGAAPATFPLNLTLAFGILASSNS